MFKNSWKTTTALVMAMGMASLPVTPALALARNLEATSREVSSREAIASFSIAQMFPGRGIEIPEGSRIRVEYTEAERIIITPDETADITLTVANDIYSSAGTLIIPEGSEIDGELRPVTEGTQFFAEQLTLPNGRGYEINARSNVITETQTITEETDPDFLEGAAIGAAAATIIAEILGDLDFLEVLAGAGLGALAALLIGGSEEEVEVVVIEPESDLVLTLRDDFELN